MFVWELIQVPVLSKISERKSCPAQEGSWGSEDCLCQQVAGEPFSLKGEQYPFHPLSSVLLLA